MAIEIGRVSTKDLTSNSYKSLGIGINRRSDSNGIFATNYTTIKQTRDNLINLIMTRKGERVMQPDFGCNIHRLIFEPIYGVDIKDRVIDAIELEGAEKLIVSKSAPGITLPFSSFL